jgi:hypothetical protein
MDGACHPWPAADTTAPLLPPPLCAGPTPLEQALRLMNVASWVRGQVLSHLVPGSAPADDGAIRAAQARAWLAAKLGGLQQAPAQGPAWLVALPAGEPGSAGAAERPGRGRPGWHCAGQGRAASQPGQGPTCAAPSLPRRAPLAGAPLARKARGLLARPPPARAQPDARLYNERRLASEGAACAELVQHLLGLLLAALLLRHRCALYSASLALGRWALRGLMEPHIHWCAPRPGRAALMR